MEWNAESVLDALNDFERKPDISPILDEYLLRVAKNGEIIFPWCKLKPLLKKKLEIVLDEFYETYPVETSVPVPNFEAFNFDNLKKTILQAVDAFTSAPFTIQRLCELVTNPQKHYNRTDKYMRGIEKNVLVVSTIEPRTGGQVDGNNANNIVIVNGMLNDTFRDENEALNGHESESSDSVSSSNMNTPSNHVLLENFANVFPSAACIPSASDICINREIDTNFISTSECSDSQEEADFESSGTSSSEELTENAAENKEEAMDTTEEEPANASSDDCLMSTLKTETVESVDGRTVNESNSPHSSGSSSEELKKNCDSPHQNNEADSSEVTEEITKPQNKDIDSDEQNPQDHTVSQSNDLISSTVSPAQKEVTETRSSLEDTNEESSLNSDDKESKQELETENITDADDLTIESESISTTEIIESESITDNDDLTVESKKELSVQQSMELESDKNSNDPPE